MKELVIRLYRRPTNSYVVITLPYTTKAHLKSIIKEQYPGWEIDLVTRRLKNEKNI